MVAEEEARAVAVPGLCSIQVFEEFWGAAGAWSAVVLWCWEVCLSVCPPARGSSM